MATVLGQRTLRSAFLRLPPGLRSCAFQRREFSSTPSRRLTLVDIAIAGPNAVLDGIHSIGIPWWAALPLTAVFVRGTLVYYLSSLPARKKAQTQALLLPLIQAKADVILGGRYAKELSEIRGQENGSVRGIGYLWLSFRAQNAATNELGKPFGAPRWTGRSLINFGMLVAFTEAIRLKCGSREGLLPLLLSPFQWIAQRLSPERFPKPVETPAPAVPEAKDPVMVLADKIEAARDQAVATAQAQAQSVPGTSRASEMLNAEGYDAALQSGLATQLSPLNTVDTPGPYYDPSFTTEGLSWFTDMTIPDSTLVLPAALSLTFLATIMLRPTVGKRSAPIRRSGSEGTQADEKEDREALPTLPNRTEDPLGALQNFWHDMQWTQRFGVFISALFYLGACNMPTAILLYFIPSIALGWVQNRWLDYKYPLAQNIQKCARPMRLKAKRQWRTAR